MKVLSEEQYSQMMADLSELISEIQNAKTSFNKEVLVKDIVDEFKISLSKKNFLFKSLKRESLELDENLVALKNVKREFEECRTKHDIRLLLYFSIGIFGGILSTLLVIKFNAM